MTGLVCGLVCPDASCRRPLVAYLNLTPRQAAHDSAEGLSLVKAAVEQRHQAELHARLHAVEQWQVPKQQAALVRAAITSMPTANEPICGWEGTHTKLYGRPKNVCGRMVTLQQCIEVLERDARAKVPARFRNPRWSPIPVSRPL